jgi:transcription-repair coupling factor (superfamily II helicase)
MATEPEKDNYQIIKIEIIAHNDETENIRDSILDHLAQESQVFVLSNEIRELEDIEWEEMQSDVSPEFFNDLVELDDFENDGD